MKHSILILAGLLMFVGHPIASAQPTMELSPTSLDFGSTTSVLWFTMKNIGGYPELSWSIADDLEPWLTLSRFTGDPLTPQEWETVNVTVNRTSMGPSDQYSDGIQVTSNGGNGIVHVEMTVPGLTISSTSGGSVTSPGEGNFNRNYGEVVSLVASAQSGFTFTGWVGDTESIANPSSSTTTITVYGYHSINATFMGLPVLTVLPQDLSFGTGLAELLVNIGNSGGGSLTWELEQDLPAWLSFPTNGAAGAGETWPYLAVVDRSGLEPGVYRHTMLIVSSGGSKEVGVTMEVPEPEPEVCLLTISSTEGGHVAVPGEGDFGYQSGSVVALEAVADLGWFFDGWSGDLEGMADPDFWNTSITVFRDHSIEARFTQGPVLRVAPSTLEFGADGQEALVSVSNEGSGLLSWEMAGGAPAWLQVSKMGGELGAGDLDVVRVSIAREGWEPGEYGYHILLQSNGGEGSVQVSMMVVEENPLIGVDPNFLEFGTSETQGSVVVQNPGSGTLNWDMVSNLPAWLSAYPMTGSTSGGQGENVTVSVARAGLSPGEYAHTVQFGSNGGEASLFISMVVAAPLTLVSPFAYLPPVIDGQLATGEWNRSAMVDIGDGYLRVQNDASCLYMLVDVVSDAEGDSSDNLWVTFDTNGDGQITARVDLNYLASATSQEIRVQFYLGEESWTAPLSSYSDVGPGYGRSLQSRFNHRLWEIAFSLPELGSRPGEKLRVGIRIVSGQPSISSYVPPAFTGDFSGLIEIDLSTRELDLLILADEDFLDELVPLKRHKDHTDLDTYVQSWQSLDLSFGPTGRDVQERVKRGIAAYEGACGIDYLMLVGDSDRFPVRYCKIWDPTHWGNSYVPADLYYADLYEQDGSFEDWDGDGDGIFGEMDGIPWQSGDPISSINLDDVDYLPDVAVGRVPASTEDEVSTYVDKVIAYEYSAYDSSWFDRAVMIVPAYYEEENDDYYDYPGSWETTEYVSANLTSAGLDPVRLYDQQIADLPSGLSDGDPNRDSINDELNKGAGFVNFAGHGNTDLWANVYVSAYMDLHFRSAEKWHELLCVGGELPVVGDFNGDGRDDIASFVRDAKTGSARGDVYVALSTGSGFGAGQIWHGNFCLGDEIPRAGDFNGDGKDDIVCFARNESDVYVALSTGSAFGPAELWQGYFCLPGEWPEVGDFDGDGRDDIVTFIKGTKSGTGANDVYVALSNGTAFGAGKLWHGSFSWGDEIPMVGDFDGDGKDDIVTFKRSAADVFVALSTGSSFGGSSVWHQNFCYPSQEPGVGDFDGDGRADVVCFTPQGGGDVWVSLSSGTKFLSARTWATSFCIGNETGLTGDFRGEGASGVVDLIGDERTGGERGDVYVSSPSKLDNADRLPIIYAAACNTAQFHYGSKYLDNNGDEFNPAVECPPCCGWNESRCWPMNPSAKEAPEPAALQRNASKNYDFDSMAEQFLVKRDVGAIAYIGCYTGSQPAEFILDKYFFEAYTLSSKPAILGDMWNRALEDFIDSDFGINPLWASTWVPQAYFHHAQKIQLYGDPSLRVGGIASTQREDSVGAWSMAHDGWLGNLSLWEAPGDPIEGTPNLEGNYTSSDGKVHSVEAWMKTWDYQLSPSWGPDHKIGFYVDFQDTISTADDQRFEGYIFTQTKDGMAGKTWWQGIPFGFYALKSRPISFEIGAHGAIERSDFLGTYEMNINGAKGILELWAGVDIAGGQPNVEGRFAASDGETYDVWGHVRTPSHPMPQAWGPNHKIEFHIDYSSGLFFGIVEDFEGYLFTQTGGAMAGVVSSLGDPYGFYAIKQAQHVVQLESGPNGTVSAPGIGSFTYQSGEIVPLSAVPSPGFKFSLWTGDIETVANVESAQTTLVVYGNCSIEATFTRVGDASTGPVIIQGPAVTCGSDWVMVTWTTDEPSNGVVKYDVLGGSYGYSKAQIGSSKIHALNITGLTPSTTYHYVVLSADEDGNQVTSGDALFLTLALPDHEDPTVSLLTLEGALNGTVSVVADATDNIAVERVEFYLNGIRVFTDYSAPYEWPFDTTTFADGSYTIGVWAYDDYGRSVQDTTKVQTKNVAEPGSPSVYIGSWSIGEDYGMFWVDLFDDNGLSTAHVYVDGVQEQFEGFSTHPNTAKIEFKWDIKSLAKGTSYRMGFMAYDIDGKMGLETIDVSLPATPKVEPELVVTSREVIRSQNVFTVGITVKNAGNGNASGVVLEDFLRLLQPISRNTTAADFIAEYGPLANWWDCIVIGKVDVPAGESRTFTYDAVPVMLQSPSLQPAFGELKLWYESATGKDYSSTFNTPVKYTKGGESLQDAYLNSLKASNYLIVTNPSRMLYYHKDKDIQELLSTMARLAMLKHGALGYLDVNSASAFDKLINSGGAWAGKLSPSFSKVGQGYLLIVGETEIVPSWHEYGFDIDWNNAPKTKDVDLTDHPYSDTTGDAAPDLVVGRVIGNSLKDLTATINRSIAVHLGQAGPDYDRSDAVFVSGTGYKQDAFVKDAADWAKTFGGKGVGAIQLHLKWYSTHDQKATAFNQSILNQDIIVYSGHGTSDEWDDIQCGLKVNPNWWQNPNDFPLEYGQTSPVVLGFACLTGNYETLDDYSIAEGFLNSGAAVYVGSTQISSIQQDSQAGGYFFSNWDATESLGEVFLEMERDRWTSDKYGKLFVWEYNLYGDPKFGAVPSLSSNAAASASEIASELLVHIPQFEATELGGYDYVEIPGGWIWMEEGKPMVPYYVQSFLCPEGTKVQSVYLSGKSGQSASTGLRLPVTVNDNRSGGSGLAAAADSGWYPPWDYLWTELENPDGTSTLVLQAFPFHYDPSTMEARFHDTFAFAVNLISSPVGITGLATDRTEYVPGQSVRVNMAIGNTGAGQAVIVDACVKLFASGEFVEGLLLRKLDDLAGPASYSLAWEPEAEEGHYYVQVEVRNLAGQVLDRRSVDFTLGLVSCELTGHQVQIRDGSVEGVSMTVRNSGSSEVHGTGVFVLRDQAGVPIWEATRAFEGLGPAESLELREILAVPLSEASSIAMHVLYEGRATDPITWTPVSERLGMILLLLAGLLVECHSRRSVRGVQ